ncbi:MAG: cation-translocating P-type ATPase [Anaerolineales bacterium]|nr:MAG: cation-translocating P-type ATPase [Anaerolineales bacterium]
MQGSTPNTTTMDEVYWHSIELSEAAGRLEASTAEGLGEQEAQKRLQHCGPNALQEEEGLKIPKLILDQFKDAFVIMLLVAAALSYIVGEPLDAVMIGIIVLLSAAIGFIQEYRSEKALEAMRKLTAPTARVLRGSEEKTIPCREVVPGDVIILEAGDRVPADARLFEAVSLKMDEAPLTGESTPVEKSLGVLDRVMPVGDRKNMIFMGTHAVYGRGRALITSTGMNTEFGKIAEAVQAIEEEKTPLKSKLDVLAKKLGMVIIGLVVVIFFLEVIEFGVGAHALVESFMTAIALAVSAVPEALPALVIVTLAIGARDLAGRNALVRKLASAETLGSTTVICADKTGTLTKGEMTVRQLYAGQHKISVSGVGYEPKGEFRMSDDPVDPRQDDHLGLLLRIGSLCSNAHYDGQKITGDPTEGALIVAAAKAGMERGALESHYPRVGEIPFSSERKRMTTLHTGNAGGVVAFMKGAPEVVLERCTYILEDGRVQELDEGRRRDILKTNEEMAAGALRVLGMAYREFANSMDQFTEEVVEKDLTFVGLQGMIDPPREAAIAAIALCRRAGIRNIMITGDHRLTALAIAEELGLIEVGKHETALTGADLDELSDEELDKRVEDVLVYARVSPMHKLKIVEALKRKGEIVAMTGDGVNDAPALKSADIGVAMGITGTDVSKEASDMVLADDNYATLVSAVEGGRAIFDNIRKYIRFLIACNFDELLVIGGWTLARFPLPMLPIQVLFINLVTDGPPAIALSLDPPSRGIMERPPRDPRGGVLDGMLAFVLASFVGQSLGSSICFAYGYLVLGSYEKAITMTFLQAALFELFVIWNCRSETESIWRMGRRALQNKYFVVGTLACILLTISLPYIPGIAEAFHVVRLTAKEWAIVLVCASFGLLILPEVLIGRKVLRWS